MQKLLLILILSGFLLNTVAQEMNYPVKKIDGKEYYIYTVEIQEGLYSISKKFGVKQSDIIMFNPDSENGLKAGQILIIPKLITTVKEKKPAAYLPKNFTYHIVEKKQTLYSISRSYSTHIDTIRKYNPSTERGLHVGDTIKIPGLLTPKKNIFEIIFGKKQEPNTTSQTEKTSQSQPYIIHTVKSKETLYSISRFYDVDIADVVKLNPGSENMLKTGSELKIPNKKSAQIDLKDTEVKTGQAGNMTESEIENVFQKKKTVRIAYLLPFMLDQSKVDAGNERFSDFYAGSLLAINEAKKKGISLEIFTFDTEKSESKMVEILADPNLRKADLIIGPAYTNQVAMIGDFARSNRINTLIPFSSKIYDIDNNPYLIQFNPGIAQTVKFVAEQIKTKYRNSKIIFTDNIDVYNSDDGKTFCELLQAELTTQNRDFSIVEISNSEQPDFLDKIDKNSKNIIFFKTDKFSNVNMFLSWLENNSGALDVAFFRHSGWAENEYNNIKSISATPFKNYLDNSDLTLYKAEFEQNFKHGGSTTSPSFDLLGYDITTYFIEILNNKGKDFINETTKLSTGKGIQSGVNFERSSKSSGIVNSQLYISEK